MRVLLRHGQSLCKVQTHPHSHKKSNPCSSSLLSYHLFSRKVGHGGINLGLSCIILTCMYLCTLSQFHLQQRPQEVSNDVLFSKPMITLYLDPQLLSSMLTLVQLRPINQSCQCCQHPQTQLKPHRQDPINGAGKSQVH